MFIHTKFEKLCVVGRSMEIKLPRKGLRLDPRVNYPHWVRFSISCYHKDDKEGITVTLIRVENADDAGKRDATGRPFYMRVFDPDTETLPDFNTTVYVYYGLPREYAPSDTTEVIIHHSVNIIKTNAFGHCKKLRRVIMHKKVKIIEDLAFNGCYSLDAIFLPSSIERIGNWAFSDCRNLRILSIPQNINIGQIGNAIIYDCDTFFRVTQLHLPLYWLDYAGKSENNDEVYQQTVIDFHRSLPPLYQACLNMNVTAQSVSACIETHGIEATSNTDYGDGMTPMHILALNPHADTGAILTLFYGNMDAVFDPYNEGEDDKNHDEDYEDYKNDDDDHEFPSAISGQTPLDCLGQYNIDAHLSVVEALCMHRAQQCQK